MTNVPFNTTNSPDLNNIRCVDLPDTVYSGTAMSRTTPMPANTYTDNVSILGGGPSFFSYTSTLIMPNWAYTVCKQAASAYAGNVVLLPGFTPPGQQNTVDTPEKRVAQLSAFIDALTPTGQTSINVAMRWSLAFLDPSMNSIYREFIASGQMPNSLTNRPSSFNDPDVLKVIVLMTDGENTSSYITNPGYQGGSSLATAPASQRSPLSPIWMGTDGNYSIFHTGRPADADFFVPNLTVWQANPWVNGTNTGTATNLTWGQIWDRFSMAYLSWQFYSRPLGGTLPSYYPMFRTLLTAATMNTQLQTVCDTARANNVVVFSIAFEATAAGQPCGTAPPRPLATMLRRPRPSRRCSPRLRATSPNCA